MEVQELGFAHDRKSRFGENLYRTGSSIVLTIRSLDPTLQMYNFEQIVTFN